MKKNNRGFAISTMLYGLLIVMVLLMTLLMSTMAFTRNNNKKFVDEIRREIEFRDLTAPKVEIVPDNSRMNFCTNVKYKIGFTLNITDQSGVINYDQGKFDSIKLYLNDQEIEEQSCTKEKKSNHSYHYQCELQSNYKGNLKVKIPSRTFYDSYLNYNSEAFISIGSKDKEKKFEEDKEPPTTMIHKNLGITHLNGTARTYTDYVELIVYDNCATESSSNLVENGSNSMDDICYVSSIGNGKCDISVNHSEKTQEVKDLGNIKVISKLYTITIPADNNIAGKVKIFYANKLSGQKWYGDTSGNWSYGKEIESNIELKSP